MHESQIRKKIKDMEACGLDVTALDDEAFSLEVKLDRCILKLIASCCHSKYQLSVLLQMAHSFFLFCACKLHLTFAISCDFVNNQHIFFVNLPVQQKA